MKELYSIGNNPEEQGLPLFEIEGNEIYPTSFHPKGMDGLPWFEIEGNEVYTSIGHPNGPGGTLV
ncbi:MAG: hypothetical protein IJY85_09445 [Ruminococcus sp.]|nr:hypothetical protein [Ruminococcus sp.]